MNKAFQAPCIGLKGIVTVEAVNGGRVVCGPVVTRNLWLDQGLDNAAAFPICELFAVAVKGTGTSATTEDLTATANTYSIPNNSNTMTRAAGTRNFTADDIGKLFRVTTGEEFTITAFTDATHVTVTPAASPAITGVKGTFYSVQQTGLDAEVARSNIYSGVAGENSTATATNVRTFKRTFVFPGEDRIKEVIAVENTFSQTGVTVTRIAGTRDFTVADLSKTLRFVDTGSDAIITAIIGVDSVAVDTAHENPEGPIELTRDSGLVEVVTGTYSRAGATVTRASGARDFTSADIGKYIYFETDAVQAKITAFTDATHVTVDDTGTLAAQAVTLYGFTDYSEIGFSHLTESGENLNIRVLLSAAVRAYVTTPLRSSDQLKATYQCTLTVTPNAATAGTLATVISDPGNAMSGNKTGSYVIETFATSTVTPNGDTDTGLVDLEPYYEGNAGLALNSDALAPLTGKVRENSLVNTPLVGEAYTPGTFARVFTGVFGLNDAVNNNWRSLMLSDPDSKLAIFTFLYTAVQKKDGEHTFTISFRKTWGRDLS